MRTIALSFVAAVMLYGGVAGAGPANGAEGLVTLPPGGDDFAKLAARAAAQDPEVDFRALRFAWLKSTQRTTGTADEDALRKDLFEAVEAGDPARVRDAAVRLLSVDYIDLYGHKFLRQACAKLNDDACAQAGHSIEFGLLNSILHTGDGKTCATGWEVVTIKEEYFILGMMGVKLSQQALISGQPSCDRMDVTDENGNLQTWYFRIDAVLADEAAMFGVK